MLGLVRHEWWRRQPPWRWWHFGLPDLEHGPVFDLISHAGDIRGLLKADVCLEVRLVWHENSRRCVIWLVWHHGLRLLAGRSFSLFSLLRIDSWRRFE